MSLGWGIVPPIGLFEKIRPRQFGASQFGLGMLASAAVSALHDGSGRPMGWVMLACLAGSAAGFVGFWRAR